MTADHVARITALQPLHTRRTTANKEVHFTEGYGKWADRMLGICLHEKVTVESGENGFPMLVLLISCCGIVLYIA